MCILIFLNTFGEFGAIISSNIFSAPFSHSSPSGSLIIYLLVHLMVPHFSLRLHSCFFILFCLCSFHSITSIDLSSSPAILLTVQMYSWATVVNFSFQSLYFSTPELPLDSVVKPKFLCLAHSEAKQTEMSEFGAKKGLLQGQARRTGGSYLKDLNSLMGFREEFLKATFGVRAAGCMTFFWLVGSEVAEWCFRNLSHQLSDQSGVSEGSYHPPPGWGTLAPSEQLKDMYQIILYTHTHTHTHTHICISPLRRN